jgi:hypothetical protein
MDDLVSDNVAALDALGVARVHHAGLAALSGFGWRNVAWKPRLTA